MIWKFADAESKFDDVMIKALTIGPQRVRRGDQTVVVISEAEYDRLVRTKLSFKDFLLSGPGLSDLDLTRDRGPMRDIE